MPYGVPDNLWRTLPPEDQNELINEYYGKQVVPSIGGYAPAPKPTPTPTPPPRQTQGSAPAQVVWAYVRSLNSFPGNHPNFAADRAAGVGGYMLKADDPYLALGAKACSEAGFRVGVWDDPHGETPEAYATRMLNAAHAVNAEIIAPDIEAIGKGYAGSAGWDYNTRAAAALRGGDPNIAIAVTPLPLQDDFNYAAWVNAGASVWVQSYGSTLDQVFDPVQVYNRAIANGVPADRLTVILPAGSLDETVAQVQNAGYPYWAIYTIDDVGSADRSVPFGDNESDPSSPQASPISDDSVVYAGDESDDSHAGGGQDTSDDYAYALVAADEAGTLDDFLNPPDESLSFLKVKQGTPGGVIHPTLGWDGYPAIDFWAKPGTILVAPFYGVVRRYSGHNPSGGWPEGAGGPWGWSIYFRAQQGYDFFITHLGTRIAPLHAVVVPGQPLGIVGHIPSGPPHCHIGVWDGTAHNPGVVRSAGGLVIQPRAWPAANMRALDWYDRTPGSTGPAGPTPVKSKSVDFDSVGSAWHSYMVAKDTGHASHAKAIRASADRLMGIVK